MALQQTELCQLKVVVVVVVLIINLITVTRMSDFSFLHSSWVMNDDGDLGRIMSASCYIVVQVHAF